MRARRKVYCLLLTFDTGMRNKMTELEGLGFEKVVILQPVVFRQSSAQHNSHIMTSGSASWCSGRHRHLTARRFWVQSWDISVWSFQVLLGSALVGNRQRGGLGTRSLNDCSLSMGPCDEPATCRGCNSAIALCDRRKDIGKGLTSKA